MEEAEEEERNPNLRHSLSTKVIRLVEQEEDNLARFITKTLSLPLLLNSLLPVDPLLPSLATVVSNPNPH